MKAYIYSLSKQDRGLKSQIVIIAENKKKANLILKKEFFEQFSVKRSEFEVECEIKNIEEGMLYGIML